MKKIAIVLALVLLISVGLVGCKKEDINSDAAAPVADNIVGTWTLTSADVAGQMFEGDDLTAVVGEEVTLEFKSDGNAIYMGYQEYTYTQNGNDIELSSADVSAMKLVKEGNTLVYKDSDVTMIFAK